VLAFIAAQQQARGEGQSKKAPRCEDSAAIEISAAASGEAAARRRQPVIAAPAHREEH